MKFFFDNCISPQLVKSLRVLIEFQSIEILHLKEKFDRANITDQEWIVKLSGESGWIIISADPRITRAKVERIAWKQSDLTGFFFTDGFASRTIYEQAAEVFRRWPEIVRLAKENPKGCSFLISGKKPIEQLNC